MLRSKLVGFAAIGAATNLPQSRIVNTWQGQDNWNFVMGKHTLKAGVNYTFQRSPNIFLPNIDGAFRFANWDTFGSISPTAYNSPPVILRWISASMTRSCTVEMTGRSVATSP